MTAQLTVTRFCEVLGIPRPTWYRWRAVSSNVEGPWPTPAQNAIEADAKALAALLDGWGHRKLAELLRTDGSGREVADSTMFRVLDRNGLTLPANRLCIACTICLWDWNLWALRPRQHPDTLRTSIAFGG